MNQRQQVENDSRTPAAASVNHELAGGNERDNGEGHDEVRRSASKTDRRDADRLASSYQAGTLTVVWVLAPKHEALRDWCEPGRQRSKTWRERSIVSGSTR
jgi:hypothetical protein